MFAPEAALTLPALPPPDGMLDVLIGPEGRAQQACHDVDEAGRAIVGGKHTGADAIIRFSLLDQGHPSCQARVPLCAQARGP